MTKNIFRKKGWSLFIPTGSHFCWLTGDFFTSNEQKGWGLTNALTQTHRVRRGLLGLLEGGPSGHLDVSSVIWRGRTWPLYRKKEKNVLNLFVKRLKFILINDPLPGTANSALTGRGIKWKVLNFENVMSCGYSVKKKKKRPYFPFITCQLAFTETEEGFNFFIFFF